MGSPNPTVAPPEPIETEAVEQADGANTPNPGGERLVAVVGTSGDGG